MPRLQIADGTSNKGKGWINGTQVVRITVRRSRTDAGVWENPGRNVEAISRHQKGESGWWSTGDFHLKTCWKW